MDADNLLHSRAQRPVSGIRAILENAAQTRQIPEQSAPKLVEETELIPTPGDAYSAYARPSSRPERTLFFLLGDGTYDGIPWSNFDRIKLLPSNRPGAGPSILMRFAGLEAVEVVVTGRNLNTLFVYLGQNRISWVREHPKGKPVIATECPLIESISIHSMDSVQEHG